MKRASVRPFVTYAFVSRAIVCAQVTQESFEITIMYPIMPFESAMAVQAIAAFFTVVTSLFGWFFLARV
jgi:hypothetical protein